MKKKKEILKDSSVIELKNKLVLLEEAIRKIRFNAEGAKSKNVKEIKETKKQIARILTELKQKSSK